MSGLVTFLGSKLKLHLSTAFLPYIREKTIDQHGIDAHQLLGRFCAHPNNRSPQEPYNCHVEAVVYRGNGKYIALSLKEDAFIDDEMTRLRKRIPGDINLPLDIVFAQPVAPIPVTKEVVAES